MTKTKQVPADAMPHAEIPDDHHVVNVRVAGGQKIIEYEEGPRFTLPKEPEQTTLSEMKAMALTMGVEIPEVKEGESLGPKLHTKLTNNLPTEMVESKNPTKQ